MKQNYIKINTLIEHVLRGGVVKTGIDIYNREGVLLLEKNVLISKITPLLAIKKAGILNIPMDYDNAGGLWDKDGKETSSIYQMPKTPFPETELIHIDGDSGIEKRVREINDLKREASIKYTAAKNNVKKVVDNIRHTGGEFDVAVVEATVSDVVNFLTRSDTAFSYVTKEIFAYDDYLYNHSVNVCVIGSAVLKKFNDTFSDMVNGYLKSVSMNSSREEDDGDELSFIYYLPEDIYDVAIGLFVHDLGKVLIPDKIINKKGGLSPTEFQLVQTHSYMKGIEILEKNKLNNTTIKNIVAYHHSPVYNGEPHCYPSEKLAIEIPPYVKIAKLSDIYDAMTSKRSYKDALNPIGVVTNLFHKYAKKNRLLQLILHAFVKVVGIYPTGSMVNLINGQLAYVIDSKGPIVIPFTDTRGNPMKSGYAPVDLSDPSSHTLVIDRRKNLVSPIDVFDVLPSFLKDAVK